MTEIFERAGRSVTVAGSEAQLFRAAAAAVVELLKRAIEERHRARWVLAGGSTPIGLYRELAGRHRAALDWSRVDFYWGDERAVSPDHGDSNYGNAREALLLPLSVAPSRVHRIRSEAGPETAAREYERVASRVLTDGSWDLVLLGLGADGHTASLFEPVAHSASWVVPAVAPAAPRERVSLTLPALNRSRHVLFLAAGESKAPAVARVLAGDPALPATHVAPEAGDVAWFLDRAAARRIRPL